MEVVAWATGLGPGFLRCSCSVCVEADEILPGYGELALLYGDRDLDLELSLDVPVVMTTFLSVEYLVSLVFLVA